MVGIAHISRKSTCYLLVAAILLAIGSMIVAARPADALQLQQRSLHINTAEANADATHAFKFSYATLSTDVGSVVFEYCTSPLEDLPCDAPAGMDASSAILQLQDGEEGFAISSATANRIVLGRPAQAVTAPQSQYIFENVINPDSTPHTFYVRITTHESTDGTGPQIDFGAVVNAITEGIDINTEVPPILNFCVGLTIGSDCSSAEGNLIDLGDLRSSVASSGSSQMLAATNANFGLAIAVYGSTMVSGTNVIPALASPTPSAPGNSQFGLNLRANSDPGIGQEPSGSGIATPTATYNIPNRYAFNSGDIVAISNDSTDIRKFTASYVVNISPNQAPGVYTSTLTYICSATF